MVEGTELEGALVPAPAQMVTAGFLRRLVASTVDTLVFAPLVVAIFAIDPSAPLLRPWEWGLLYAVSFGYGVLMLGRYGWTVGMRVLKVHLTATDQNPVGYKRAALRTFAYVLPSIVSHALLMTGEGVGSLFILAAQSAGLLWMIVDRNHQGYHDKIAKTFVVRGVRRLAAEAPPPRVITLPASRRLWGFKWAAFALLLLLCLSPAGVQAVAEVAASRVEREINAILAELKAQGKPIKPIDLAPPPVPDVENAALVYEEAYKKLQLADEVRDMLGKALGNWTRGRPLGRGLTPTDVEMLATGGPAPGPPFPPPGVKAPPPGALEKGDWGKAKVTVPGLPGKVGIQKGPPTQLPPAELVPADELASVERQPWEPTDAEVLAAAKKLLERNHEPLVLVHKAAGMEKCRLDIEWEKGINILYPQFSRVKGLARLLEFEAMVLSMQGDTNGALRAAMAMLDVSDSLRTTPTLIALLVQAAITNMGLQTVERILYQSMPLPAACRAAEERLAPLEFREELVRALEGERAMHLDLLEEMRTHWPPEMVAGTPMGLWSSGSLLRARGRRTGGVLRWWLTWEEHYYLEGMALNIQQARHPLFQKDRRLESRLQELEVPPKGFWDFVSSPRILSCISLGVYDGPDKRTAQAETAVGLARIALLLKVHRAERGYYPESLDEMELYAGKELPLDPCSGKPFHYRREGQGFLLYSVGVDGVDNGGKVEVRASQEAPIPPLSSREGADIVWVCKQ